MNKEKQKGYLENIKKPLWQLKEDELREILDTHWWQRARDGVVNQRKIWDYSYLAYKGIMLWEEINRKRRANEFGLYVNVPRTFTTIEGVRRHFNLSKLKVALNYLPNFSDSKRKAISEFVNYDLKRGGSIDQVKDAAFYKLLYGNGFLYTYLADRRGRYGNIIGDVDNNGYVKSRLDDKDTVKYFGMVARAISPYNVFPDPDGTTHDFNDIANAPVNYVCIRTIKHINTFRRDWKGIVPDKILDEIEPGGNDMTNYEVVKDTIDSLFSTDALRYSGTLGEYLKQQNIQKEFSGVEYVEERLWLGEDFTILQAGAGLKFCLVSPNPNPKKDLNLIKLDDVRIPGEYWAMGEPYIMRYQQIEENRIHNAVLDTLHFSISGMVGINTQYLEDQHDTDIYPQKVWKLKAMPGVKIDEMLQTYNPSSSGIAPALKFMEEVKKVGQSTTSITDFVTGASKSIADTATEAQKLSSASDFAIADKIKEMAGGALSKVAKRFISMYPIAYENEKVEGAEKDMKICFVGETQKQISEKKLTELLKIYNQDEIVFLDDVDIMEPRFFVTGEVSMDRAGKLAQWSSAIDYAKSINEVSYQTGDPRRIDIIKMGLMAMENFDVIDNTEEFLLNNQPTKIDEIQMNAEMNQQAAINAQAAKNQMDQGGRPKENKIAPPQTSQQRMRQVAQPNNRGVNQLSKKNI